MNQFLQTKNKLIIFFFSPTFFIVDQIVFPMLRLGPFSFKISYILLPLYSLLWFLSNSSNLKFNRRLSNLINPIIGIAFLGFIGQVYLGTFGRVINPYEALKQEITYFLIIFGILLGYSNTKKSNLKLLVIALYFYLIIIILLSLFFNQFTFIAKLWWGTLAGLDEKTQYFAGRPTPFGDSSMVGANLLFLFIVISKNNGWLDISLVNQIVLSIGVFLVSLLLQGRNQIALSMILIFFLFYSKHKLTRKKYKSIFLLILVLILFLFVFEFLTPFVPQLDGAIKRIEATQLFNSEDNNKDQSILLRPFRTLERSYDRFIKSPIWGSGFSVLDFYPFARLNPHNDYFYIIITSGTIGLFLYFIWIIFIVRYTSWLMILPFITPGLTNSFITAIGGVVAYSIFLGIYVRRTLIFKS